MEQTRPDPEPWRPICAPPGGGAEAAILCVALSAPAPILLQIGLETVHVDVMIVFNLMTGTLTPPFGIIFFTVTGGD